ncbi:MAG: hypothetical protein QOI88_1292, partial [Gammaproteobacteria bacterium]|nr:hypothetical protein [Gammaproteobacteria bacterium]
MTIFNPAVSRASPAARRLAPALFATTLFLSAFLLFLVQPMFTKLVLPRLGGAPTVWSVAMVFFQIALLAGYAYAHLVIRRFTPGTGGLVHLGLLAAAALTLPIGISEVFGSPPQGNIALWLMALYAVSIGLPFAVLSASAPLLQGWFAASGHQDADNPYVLYAASNLGSFAALMAYPVIVEPILSLRDQAHLWSIGFGVLAVLVGLAGLMVARQPKIGTLDAAADPVSVRDRLAWLALAAIPAGLVIALTSYITTDIASAPFLWVIPLALYLLTFVAAFRDRPWIPVAMVVRLVPFCVAPLVVFLLGGEKIFWLAMIAVNLIAFLLIALMCHANLYGSRPAPARLTEFYLWVSLGGVIGGIFAALIAPYIFNRIYEYPILLLAGLAVLPGTFAGGARQMFLDAGPILAIVTLAIAAWFAFDIRLPATAAFSFYVGLMALAAIMLTQRDRPVRFIALAAIIFVISGLWQPGLNQVETARSFFGVHQVAETADGNYRLLFHGTTLHGAERIEAAGVAPPEPITYYYFGGPISDGIAAARGVQGGVLREVAVVGLGSGSLACHARDAEDWTFFEIDPDVVEIAKNPRLFTFISSCKPNLGIVLGDARLTLATQPSRYDLIVLDAFSSDVVPIHLLTREAFAVYLAHLKPKGALVLHISNRHMELAKVVAAVGAADGLLGYIKLDDRPSTVPNDFKTNAQVVALARR